MSYEDLASLVTFRPLERRVGHGPTRWAPFKAPWGKTVSLLAKELRAHGARQTVLEVDLRGQDIRLDGLPRADRNARTPGIVLSFKATSVPGSPDLRYEVAEFTDWRDNVRAIALGLEALRAVDRYGVTRRGEQYAGWKQLAAGTGVGEGDPVRGRELIEAAGGDEKEALRAPRSRAAMTQTGQSDSREVQTERSLHSKRYTLSTSSTFGWQIQHSCGAMSRLSNVPAGCNTPSASATSGQSNRCSSPSGVSTGVVFHAPPHGANLPPDIAPGACWGGRC